MPADDADIARLRRMLRANPGSLQFVALGEALRSRGRFAESVDVLQRGLAQHPELRSGQAVLARVYSHTGQRELALRLLDRLVPEDPGNAALACLQIELWLADGNLAAAADGLQRFTERNPRDAAVVRLRAQLAALRPSPKGEDPYLCHALGHRLEAARRFERALAIWDALADAGDEKAAARAQQLRSATIPSKEIEDVPMRSGSQQSVERLQRWLDVLDGVKQEVTW